MPSFASDVKDELARLMENKELRIKMGGAARESMRAYDAPTIWNAWEKLLYAVQAKVIGSDGQG